MARQQRRREFLAGLGAAGVVGLAGCLSGGGDGTTTEASGGGDGTTTESTEPTSEEPTSEETTAEDSGENASGGNASGEGVTDETTEEDATGETATDEGDTGETGTTSGDGGDSGSGDGRSISVGVLQPTTGDLADLGTAIRDAALLPAVQVNNADTDFDIDTQAEDTQTDAQAGIEAAQALVDAGYPSITGAASSETTIQVAQQIAIPNQVVMCSPASTSPDITGLDDSGYIFRTPPSDALQGQVLAQVASERLGVSSVSVLYVNNAYGQALADSFASAFGGEVPAQVGFEPEQGSYTSVLEEALSSGPGSMLVIGYPASGNQLFRDFYANYSEDLPVLVTDGLRSSDLPGNVGTTMTNVQGTAPLAAGPARDFFNQAYQDEYGEEPGVFTSQAYDATAVQILANAAGGENTGSVVQENMDAVANPEGTEVGPENLAEAVGMAAGGEEINYQGASSNLTFDDNGDIAAASYEIFEYTEDDTIEQADVIEFSASDGGDGGSNQSANGSANGSMNTSSNASNTSN